MDPGPRQPGQKAQNIILPTSTPMLARVKREQAVGVIQQLFIKGVRETPGSAVSFCQTTVHSGGGQDQIFTCALQCGRDPGWRHGVEWGGPRRPGMGCGVGWRPANRRGHGLR